MRWYRTALSGLMIAAVSLSGPSTLDHARPIEGPTIEILVAQRSLNVGDLFRHPETQFPKKRIRQGDVPEGAITSFADLTGRILKRSLRKGDHITRQDLCQSDDLISIPEGYRFVSLRIESKTLPCLEKQLYGKRVDLWQAVELPTGTEVKPLLEGTMFVAFDLCGGFGRDANPHLVATFLVHVDDMPKLVSVGSFRITLPSPP